MPAKRKSGGALTSASAAAAATTTTPNATLRRSSRHQKGAEPVTEEPAAVAAAVATAKKQAGKRQASAAKKKGAAAVAQTGETEETEDEEEDEPAPKKSKIAKEPAAARGRKAKPTKTPTENGLKHETTAAGAATPTANGAERQYWLMKAEPETRLENGVDVKFSIDDLASRSEPEPWDGIRNYAARNNLRAMKKGDLAFFYHSNCKEPGVVGTMEIVEEHSPDLSAHDPKTAYYDASSKPSDPKWSVVHVEFRSKFAGTITLKELRDMGGPGNPLQDMQMLKQTRLSVSKVSAAEWTHLMAVAESKGPVVNGK